MNAHLEYMKRAYQLALKARGKTSPNPLVGAVIVKKGHIVAEGYHKRCGSDHAEIVALKKARQRARGASLYVTLEPCFHYGRTPPCVDKIIQSGIKEVYVGMIDPNPLTHGKSIQKLRRANIKVHVGFMTKELAQMNEAFIKYIKFKRPFVVAKCAQTLDGKIATAQGQSKWITSEKTRTYTHQLRNDFDAILVGINTVLKDDPRLNAAAHFKRLKKIVLDTQLKISPQARLFKNILPSDCLLATTKKSNQSKVNFFKKKGVGVIICPERDGKIDLRWLFKYLAKQEITNILIEGGSTVIGQALKDGLVDKMYIYIAPKIMGDQNALNSFVGRRVTHVKQAIPLRDIKIKQMDRDIFIEGYVHRNH